MKAIGDDKLYTELLEALYHHYGYDFRGYAESSLKRRINGVMIKLKLPTLLHLKDRLLDQKELFPEFLSEMTVPTSEMFRDPQFFKALRTEVLPILATYPTLKVWHAGCSTGEEVYSLAILLKEAGLYQRCVIYATDVSPRSLGVANCGIYSAESVKAFTANYYDSGGQKNFSEYYTAAYGRARFDPALAANVVFAEHNLAADDVFSQMNLILCRNVLIYFNRKLKDRALDLFARSLCHNGFLCLGSKESLRFSKCADDFKGFGKESTMFRSAGRRRNEPLILNSGDSA